MMVRIDSIKCTGCGDCVEVCPQRAITIHDNMAMINEDLCIQCGSCAEVCPAGAIREVAPVYTGLQKGGESMPFGGGWFGWSGRGRGNPYLFCRYNPWLPRRWWAARPASYSSMAPSYYSARRPFIRW